jgi:RNA polymerase sigma factor for flagellar operon FliA
MTTTAPTAESLAEHMHLVHRIVAHFVRRLPRSVQREDLVAAGTLGLFYALRSSEHTCPEMFASYARIRIRGSIVDELRRHDWAPRRRKEKVATSAASNASVSSRPSNVVELRPRPSLPPTATAAVAVSNGPVSIAPAAGRLPVQVVGFDDLPPTVTFREEGASPLEEFENKSERELLQAAMNELPPREAQIIRMRYFEGIPSKAIAEELGLSEARISQLHARATQRLKAFLADAAGELDLAA